MSDLPNLSDDSGPKLFLDAVALVSTWILNPEPVLNLTHSLYV